jgi:hypothetical protein
MSAEQLEKYEAWIRELESRQKILASNRAAYLRGFVVALVVSAAGFFWNTWIGAATLFTGILFCAFGFYVVMVREGEYVRDLKHTRREVYRLRAAAEDASHSSVR